MRNKTIDSSNSILVVIVTYNAMKWIDRCLKSLYESSISTDIFIIDNVSNDETVEHIKKNHSYLKLLESKVNLGFGKANNLGFQYALENNYEYVYLLNQDAWVFSSTFSELISIHNEHKQFGILSPMQLYDGCKKLDSNFLLCCPRRMFEDTYCNGNLDRVYETDFVMAAHWLISRDCLSYVGGFSPSFPHYGEDHNFIQRARFFNYKVGLVPSALAVHDRESRVDSKALKIRKLYLQSVVAISDININVYINLFKQPLVLLIGSIRYMSVSSASNAIKFILKLPLHIKNRSKSKKTAFLNQNK